MVKVSQEHSAQLRRRVLDAAVTELAASGHAALAVTAVAHRAGLATSAITHRFPTKDQLISAVVHERLEPTVGRRVDETSDWLWGPPRPAPIHRRSAADAEGLDAWHQILVAAAFPSGPRDDALTLLQRRLGYGLARRADAPSGTVRSVADPAAQTAQGLLLIATDLGTWLLLRGLGHASRQKPTAMPVVRSAVRIEPASPIDSTPGRRLPRDPVPPPRHAHDRLGETLLAATASAVQRDGFAVTTVAGIARRAGSSTGAVYNRFTGKGGLLAECLLATTGSAPDDRTTAVRVESLRIAPTDPEVAAAVTAVEGQTLRAVARSLVIAQQNTGRRTMLDPSSTARLAVAFPLGNWVLGRILTAPTEAWHAAGARIVQDLTANPPPGPPPR